MLVLLWIFAFLLYVSAVSLLIVVLLNKLPVAAPLRDRIYEWLDEARSRRLFSFKTPKYPVELWKWETLDDEEVCEDCLERASWPPMDIADWMKEGMPRTEEAETHCGENCRCELVIYEPRSHWKKHPGKQQ